MVEPPLFSFKEDGKKIFLTTNREYITYLQKKFSKDNLVYRNGKKLDDSQLFDFLLRNERYLEYLKNVADNNVCSMEFTELIISNLQRFGIEKSSMSKWDDLVRTKFSKQLNTEWVDGRIVISGIKDGRYEMIELDDDLINSKKTGKLLNLINSNLNVIYGYEIEGTHNESNISVSKILQYFSEYKAKDLKRYKGLSLGQLCSNV